MFRSLVKFSFLLLLIPLFFLFRKYPKYTSIALLLGVLSFLAIASVKASAPSSTNLASYDYLTRVDIRSTSALSDQWIPFDFPVNQLITNSFVSQADADDILSVEALGNFRELVGQGITGDANPTFWVKAEAGDVPADTDRTFELHTSNATVTHDYPLGLLSTDSAEVPDDASLDITTRLTMESLGTILDTIPTAENYLVNTNQAYGLGVRNGNEVFAYINDDTFAGALTEVLRPDGAGNQEDIASEVGCAAGSHWQCVDEAAADDGATYVWTVNVAFETDLYTIGSSSIPPHAYIDHIDVSRRNQTSGAGQCQTRPRLRLNAVETIGGQNNNGGAWATATNTVARPGGGAWSVADLANLEVGVDARHSTGAAQCQVTQVFATVYYDNPIEALSATIAVDTQYDFRGTYDGANLRLYIDDVLTTTTASVITIDTTTTTVDIGPFSGEVHRTVIHSTDAIQLDETANSNDSTNTLIVGTTGQLEGAGLWNATTSLGTVADAASIQNIWGGGGGTVEAWFNPYSDGENNAGRVVDKSSIWYLAVQDEAAGLVRLAFFIDFDGADNGFWRTDVDIPISTLTHAAVIYDSGNVANNPTFIINGTDIRTVGSGLTEANTPVGTRVTDVGSDLVLGNRPAADVTWDGILDDIRVWDDTRTSTEVANNYNIELTVPVAGLVAYYQLNDAHLDFSYEPSQMAETDKGDGGDGWTWEGTLTDNSNESNNGTYLLTRTYVADLTVSAGSPELKSVPVNPDFEGLIASAIGDFDAPDDLTAGGAVDPAFPFADIFNDAANEFASVDILWLAFMGSLAYLFSLVIAKATKMVGFGYLTASIVLFAGSGFGMYAFMYPIIAIIFYFGLFAWNRNFNTGGM